MKIKPLSLLIILALLATLVACGGQPAVEKQPAAEEPAAEQPAAEEPAAEQPAAEEATEVFKLGVLGPFSGPAAQTGDEFKGSFNMAFEAIDWQIGQYKIEPVWIDSQSDPAKASQAYEQAIVQDGIQAGVLNWHSSVAVSVMEVTAKHKIPHFFGFGATEVVNETFASDPEKYGYWMVKGWPTPAKLSISYVQALEDAIAEGTWAPADKTVAIYGEDTDWGRSFGGAIKGQLEEAGWTVVAEEYFAIDQTEFYPLLNKFKELNPALVAGTSTAAPTFSALIKQADEVGLESLIVADGLGWFGEWYDLTGSSSNYVLDQIPGFATEEGKAFAQEFETKWGFKPSPSAAGLAYDGSRFFIALAQEVIKEKGELTSESIYNFVKEKVWTGEWTYTDGIVMSEYKYTQETIPDPIVGKGYYIFPVLQYFDGEGKVIYPPDWAVQQLTPKGQEPVAAEAPAEEATEVFKLGVLGPFSGPAAQTGDEFKGSFNMAFEAIDWQIGQYKIEPVWIDSQSDPAKASQAYEQAIVQDGIQAGVLNWHSSVAVSVMEVTAKHKIPHFFGFGATEVVNETFASDPEKYGYWMVKGWPTPAKLSISYVQALEDAIAEGTWAPADKTVAIYGEDTDWGRSFGGAIKGQLEEAGWTVVAEEYFAIDQTEFYPLLNKFKELNPALVAGTSTAAPTFSALIKQADEVGLESLIVADGLGWFGEWYDLTGSSSNYVLDQIPGFATEEGKAFAQEFETKWGFKPSPSAAGLAYDGSRFFIALAQEVIKEKGELTSESIYNFVKEKVWTGEWTYTDGIVMSEYKYTQETIPDPIVGKGYYIFPVLQYFDGEGKVIYPPDWAVQKFTPKAAP
ncbi:MAG: ABC transporter substrate-binding protein [Chloroflexota bacterium]